MSRPPTTPVEFVIFVSRERGAVPADSWPFPARADGPGSNRSVELRGPGLRMSFATNRSTVQSFWREEDKGGEDIPSFVFVLGWCYRIGSSQRALTEKDFREMLVRQRRGLPPCSDELSGTYVAVVHDAPTGELRIQPDCWAMRNVSYGESESAIVVSSHALAAASILGSAIDGYSALSFMRNAIHMPLGSTFFTGVRRVLCGCYLSIDLRSPRMTLHRATSIYVPERPGGFAQCAEELREGLRPIARRLADCNSAVFDLTGGNDTRMMAAMMSSELGDRWPEHLSWNTVGFEGDPDVVVARRVAAICGWGVRRIEPFLPADSEPDELIEAALLSDGSCVTPEALTRIQFERYGRGEWEWLVGAFAAEPLRGYWWKQEFFRLGRTRVDFSALLDYRLRPSKTLDTKLLGGHWPNHAEHNDVLLEAYRQIGRASPGVVNARQIDAMYMHRLIYSGGNSHSFIAPVRDVRLPYITSEFLTMIHRVPWKLRIGRRLMLRVIELMKPELGAIPTDSGGPMRPLALRTLPLYFGTVARIGKLAVRLAVRRSFGRLGVREVLVQNPIPDSWLEMVRRPEALGEIVEPARLREICDAAQAAPAATDERRLFETLLTMELLLRGAPRLRRAVEFGSRPVIPEPV